MFVKRYIEASKKEASQIKNIIKRRMFLAFRMKIAGIVEDLKTFDKFKKYFVTKEEAEQKVKELKETGSENEQDFKDAETWYEINNNVQEVYVYSIDGDEVSLGKCCMVEFLQGNVPTGVRNYVVLAGIYKVNDKGAKETPMIAYKDYIDLRIEDAIEKLTSEGMFGYGKTYRCMKTYKANFNQISNFAKTVLNKELKTRERQKQKNEKNVARRKKMHRNYLHDARNMV